MRFLDNVVDATEYFFEENARAQLSTRRTGLGTMGLADALIKLHVPYGSDESAAGDRADLPHHPRRRLRGLGRPAAEKGPFPQVRP